MTLEIVKTFVVGLLRVRDIKIAGPLRLQRRRTQRRKPAFARSGLSTKAITANLEGLRDLFVSGGLAERIAKHSDGLDRSLLNDLDHVLGVFRSVNVTMKQVVDDPDLEDKLIAVGFPLKNVKDETAAAMSAAAGITIGVNTLDGD